MIAEETLDYDPLSEIKTDRTDDEAANVLLVQQKRKELKRANTGLFVALIPCALTVILIIPAIIGIGLLMIMRENNRKIAALDRHGINVLVNGQVDLDLAERLDGELPEEEIDGSLAIGLDPDTPEYKLKAYEDGWLVKDPNTSVWLKPISQTIREWRYHRRYSTDPPEPDADN